MVYVARKLPALIESSVKAELIVTDTIRSIAKMPVEADFERFARMPVKVDYDIEPPVRRYVVRGDDRPSKGVGNA